MAEDHEVLVGRLQGAAKRYLDLKGYFDHFSERALALAEASPVKGIVAERTSDTVVRLAFLDRCLTVSLRFDSKARKGVLHVEDVSAIDTKRVAMYVDRIEFDGTGETALPPLEEGGDPLTLSDPGDCVAIALRCIDKSLQQDPWASEPAP